MSFCIICDKEECICTPEIPMYPDLRDQFAMAALTGIITRGGTVKRGRVYEEDLAHDCYVVADSMLEARKK